MRSRATQAKHKIAAGALKRDIEAGRWHAGDQLPSEHHLARRFDVAYMTMRQAVSGLVEDGVLIRVRGKGTYIAAIDQDTSNVAAETTMTLLFPTDWLRDDPYYLPQLLEGFQQTIEAHGYRAALANYDVADVAGVLGPNSAVACLLVGDSHIKLVDRLLDSGHNVLAVNHYTGRRRVQSVWIDDASAMEQAVAHLVLLGHSRIGFLRGDPTHLDSKYRLRGFRAAARRYGLTSAGEAGDGFTEASGYAAALELLARPYPPSALLCASDLCALGATKAARELGLSIPADLSIVGFGDFSVAAYMNPGLTTIRQAREELGRSAAGSLIALRNGEPVESTILPTNLVLRESTAICRTAADERANPNRGEARNRLD